MAASPKDNKPAKSRLCLGVMNVGFAILAIGLLTLLIVYFDLGGRYGEAIKLPVFCFGMSLAFGGSFMHALCTGEIPLTKRPCRKEDGVPGYYVCLAVTGIAALMSLAVCIQSIREALLEM